MYGNKHIEGKKKRNGTYYNMVLIYEGIWNYLKKAVINLNMALTNLRVNTSIPSPKKRHKKSKVEVKMKYQKYSMYQKMNSKSGDSSQIWEEGKKSS